MEQTKTLTREQLRLVQSLADIRMCLSALAFLSELEEDQRVSRIERRRYRCFEDAATVAYCRAFSGAGLAVLKFEDIGLSLTDECLDLHRKIRTHRDKVIAHSDADRMRVILQVDKLFENEALMLPIIDFDDGLVLYKDRSQWSELAMSVHGAVYKTLFDQMQGQAPFRFLKDWLHEEL